MNAEAAPESSFGSFGSPPPPAGGAASTKLPGIAGTESEKQLTQRELQALKSIKKNVDRTKYAGWILGAAGTYALLARRKPRPTRLSLATYSFFGGIGGSFVTMPIGIIMSRRVLNDVEDPQHLRRVLMGAMQEQRQGKRPQVGVAPPPGIDGQPPQQQSQDWGAAATEGTGFGQGGDRPVSDGGAAALSTSSNDQAQAASTDPLADGTGPGTRWSQLRGERGVEPSKWERIRQDNARTAYNRNGAQSQQQQQQPTSEQPSFDLRNENRRSGPSRNAEPTMTLSGDENDPRWSSPADFAPQSSGWGDSEFIEDTAGQSNPRSARGGAKRGYGILSVLEDGQTQGNPQGFQVESDAPIQVVKGSLLAALAGGIGGSVYGVMKGPQGAATVLGPRTAFNFFAFSFPFFAVREYVISPVLNRTSSGPDPANRHMRLRTVPNRHTDKLLASGFAGAIVGGGLAGFARGPQTIPKGIVTFGVACIGLQLAGNELRLARNLLLKPRRIEETPVQTPSNGANAAIGVSQAVPPPISDGAKPAPATSAMTPNATTMKSETTESGASASKSSILSKVKGLMPIRSISDDEYEKKLEERLGDIHQRMANIEAELKDIEDMEKEREQAKLEGPKL